MLRLNHLLKEVEEPNHDFDRDMVVGVSEILLMVNDMDNRKEIADKMIYFLTNKSKVRKELDFDLILSKYSWKESVKMFIEGLKSNEN